MTSTLSGPSAAPPHHPPPSQNDRLKDAAMQLEAAFLAEMLKSAGLNETSDAFGGGAGEERFTSFLVDQQALQIARSGGVGLAEALFHALKERADGQG
jgi:Rod binding domain-containing protein